MYWTYGIVDPVTGLFVYIGQTSDFDRRKSQHLTDRLRKTTPARGSIQEWLRDMRKRGLEPDFVILEIVETEEESLLSESKWVEKFAAIGHPLLNRWQEHRDLIRQGRASQYEALIFQDGKACRVGEARPNRRNSGFAVMLDKDVKIEFDGMVLEGARIDVLEPKPEA